MKLPYEICEQISNFLDLQDKNKLGQTNKTFKTICQSQACQLLKKFNFNKTNPENCIKMVQFLNKKNYFSVPVKELEKRLSFIFAESCHKGDTVFPDFVLLNKGVNYTLYNGILAGDYGLKIAIEKSKIESTKYFLDMGFNIHQDIYNYTVFPDIKKYGKPNKTIVDILKFKRPQMYLKAVVKLVDEGF